MATPDNETRPGVGTEASQKRFAGAGSKCTGWTAAEVDAERHAAYLAGYDQGVMHANRVAAQAIAQELLSAQAAEMAGWARREATRNHGPAWAALVCDDGSTDDAA